MVLRYFGIQEEAAFGTAEDDAYKYIPIIEEGITEDNDFKLAETIEAREVVKGRMGAFKCGGPFSQYIEPENIGWQLKAMFGTVADSGVASVQLGATAAYKHTFKPTNNGPRSYTLEAAGDVVDGAKKYTSALFRSMEISAAVGELLGANFDIIAQSEDIVAHEAAPSFSSLEPFVFHEADVEIGGSPNTAVTAIKIKFENAGFDGIYGLNSREYIRKHPGAMKITGAVDLIFDALTEKKRFFGAAAATTPAAEYTRHAIALNVDGPATGEDAHNYEFNISLPLCVFKTNKDAVSKRELQVQNLTFEALYSASTLVELQNKVTAYADAV